jgi:predicted glycosyltransferase
MRVREQGGDVLAATRDKDVTVRLCRAYDIPQIMLSRANAGQPFAQASEFLIRTLSLLRAASGFKPDALLGTSVSIGVVGRLIGRPSFVFNEDDAHVVPFFAKIAYPSCSYVVTPECLKHEYKKAKHLTYEGYHELAYLHPDVFRPNPEVLRAIDLDPDQPFFILRFVSLRAHHDSNATGLPTEVAQRLVDILLPHGRVLITAEEELGDEFKKYQFPLPPHMFHDILAFASMVIGDSQTVADEAAVMGVPSLRCNTFVGRLTYLEELEKEYGLTKGFLPNETQRLLGTVRNWLVNLKSVKEDMQHKRNRMLQDTVSLSDWQWNMLCKRVQIKP